MNPFRHLPPLEPLPPERGRGEPASQTCRHLNARGYRCLVNLFLGNLLEQLARKRIRRRDAVALAYICQLLLNSLAALNREQSPASDESDSPSFVITNDIPRPQRELPAVPAEPQ